MCSMRQWPTCMRSCWLATRRAHASFGGTSHVKIGNTITEFSIAIGRLILSIFLVLFLGNSTVSSRSRAADLQMVVNDMFFFFDMTVNDMWWVASYPNQVFPSGMLLLFGSRTISRPKSYYLLYTKSIIQGV
jgi:hypothetical protein